MKRTLIFTALIASSLMAPSAFAQVLGGNVGVSGGVGLGAGPAALNTGIQTRGDLGVRTDTVRDAGRRARHAVDRATVAADTGVNVAAGTASTATGAVAGATRAAADQGAQAVGAASGQVTAQASGGMAAQASGQLKGAGDERADQPRRPPSGSASAESDAAVTGQSAAMLATPATVAASAQASAATHAALAGHSHGAGNGHARHGKAPQRAEQGAVTEKGDSKNPSHRGQSTP